MDWDDSYYTMSDENNYTIWHFLKTCHERGWIYKGHDVMPWCPRCGTGISDQEIVTEGYQERTHLSVFVRFPLLEEENASLLVWTTTPWTLAANVAAAVHPELTYVKAAQDDRVVYVAKDAAKNALRGDYIVTGEVAGADLVGRAYRGPFDELPANSGVVHRIIPWDEVGCDRRHRHRPHRARLRQGGLRPLQGARPGRRCPDQRVRRLPRRFGCLTDALRPRGRHADRR